MVLLWLAVAAAAVAVAVAQQWLGWLLRRRWCRQPPGPLPLPFLGNLLYLMASSCPHRTLRDLSRKYGPLSYLQLGVVPTVIVSSPASAQQILSTYDKSFAGRLKNKNAGALFYGIDNTAFMCPYGDKWRFIRKFYSVHMFNARCIQEMQIPIVQEEILNAMMGDLCLSASRAGSEIDITKLFGNLLHKIIYRIALGKHPDDIAKTSKGVYGLADETERLLGVKRIGEYLPILSFLDYGLDRTIDRHHRDVDRMLQSVLSEREESPITSAEVKEGRKLCLLDTMLGLETKLDKTRMKAMAWEIIVGGTKTSSSTLDWTMAELLNNERVMKKAVEEIDRVVSKERMVTIEDVKHMPYVKAVVKESMRLHPTGTLMLPHSAMESCDVELPLPDGSGTETYRFEVGTQILVNAWAIGRDEATWGPNFAEFAPERFLEGSSKEEVNARGQHFELLPFGSGRRICPGLAAAIPIVELTIASFLHCFQWTATHLPVDMTERFGINTTRASYLPAIPGPFRLHLSPYG